MPEVPEPETCNKLFNQQSIFAGKYQYGPVTKKNYALSETDMHRVYRQIRNARQRHFLQGQGGN